MVERLLRYRAGALLGISSEHIQRERALLEMGLDSLMAVELRNWIEAQMQISLPIAALMRSSSLTDLVARICEIIEHSASEPASTAQSEGNFGPQASITGQQASDLLEQLPALADAEVSQLLERLLRGQGN